MLRATLRFLTLTLLVTYLAMTLTVTMIVLLFGAPVWTALAVGISFPIHFIVSLVSP